ncbi:thioredoxin-like [Antennarius striatus]|uniref:thioredoxin-like n=1 Tax=Antennarius striatus TaxID=241820 RepID=UPI0035AE9C29
MSSSGEVIAIESEDHFNDVLHKNQFVLVEFRADWCGPCRMMAQVVEQAAEFFKDDVVIVKVDCDTFSNLAQTYNVISIPTVIAFSGGQVVGRRGGCLPSETFKSFINEIIGKK